MYESLRLVCEVLRLLETFSLRSVEGATHTFSEAAVIDSRPATPLSLIVSKFRRLVFKKHHPEDPGVSFPPLSGGRRVSFGKHFVCNWLFGERVLEHS